MPTAVQLRARVIGHLNSAPLAAVTTYPSTQATGGKFGFADAKIDDAVADAAAIVNGIIAATPNHPRRSALETALPATNGAPLAAHVGPAGAVTIASKPGVLTSADDVKRLLANVLGLSGTAGYYGWDGSRLYFTGTPCTVDLVTDATIADVTKVPAECVEAVVAKAVAALLMLEGDPEKAAAAAHYRSIANDDMQLIAGGNDAPETPPYAP